MWTLVNNCDGRSIIDTHVKTENWNVNQNSADRNYKMEDFIKKKIINSSDNYHYHKLDIRKSEIVFTFCSKVHWRKSKLSHRGKIKDEQRTNGKFTPNINEDKIFPKNFTSIG